MKADFSLAEVNFIDGQALAPTDFGEYDDNNVWQPKEVILSSINDGTVWSTASTITGSPDSASYSYSNVFDGTPYAGATAQADNTQTPYVYKPNTAITASSSIRIRMAYYGNPSDDFFKVNGTNYGNAVKAAMSASTETWYTLPIQTINTANGIAIKADGTNSFNIAAIEVDGEIMVDSYNNSTGYGTNGFHLDFSDNTSTTTIAEDSSGNNNDFTSNNFSVASGAGLSLIHI